MFCVSFLRNALFLLIPISITSTFYLYFYPIFHLCAFPAPGQDAYSAYTHTLRLHAAFPPTTTAPLAPFRLLALGDPQLEGDSSIAGREARSLPHYTKLWKDILCLDGLQRSPLQRLRHGLHDMVDLLLDDIPKVLYFYRKRVDHVGNDYYLGHIYRTLHWWTRPTHVTALGDLVGSQWIDDAEFARRGARFWNRVFKHGQRVPDSHATDPQHDTISAMPLNSSAAVWSTRIMNVAGNHDVGYAGDLSEERLDRFSRVFGKPNYELRFHLPISSPNGMNVTVEEDKPPVPEIRIVVLNDMNLDAPASSPALQDSTYAFLNKVITTSQPVGRSGLFTLVLTHIPLHKAAGLCVDGPYFDFFDGDFNSGIKEQNQLSVSASRGILEGIFGMSGDKTVPGQGKGRNGMVITGHDHEGCETYHYINQSLSKPPDNVNETAKPSWQATTWFKATCESLPGTEGIPGLREVTIRSMMGDFGGNAGLLSLWFDEKIWEWKAEFVNCALGSQHVWWVIHVLDLITLLVLFLYCWLSVLLTMGWDFDWFFVTNRRAWKGNDGMGRRKARGLVTGSEKKSPISPTTDRNLENSTRRRGR